MGRPKLHDEQTAAALLVAAEGTIEQHGVAALSLRELAREANTTTRAVYSLFRSKEGLLGALGARAFELLQDGLEAIPLSGDPHNDLIEAAVLFRRFALDHPALFSIGIQRADPTIWPSFQSAASDALAVLQQRVRRLAEADLLGGRSIREATLQFHSLCEGLAAVELRGIQLPPNPEQFWREAFHTLISGFAAPREAPAAQS